MLVTQSIAIQILRAETGRSIEWCVNKAREMADVKDGKRTKVRRTQLHKAIRIANEVKTANCRPLSTKKIRQLVEIQ